ncbi:hypothetical protein [Flavobacterium sp. XS2P39]|uniref:hypothetical protein n=1 Tax=Flavobacterium sp. XS2P39 TaxID=3401725 RepID=UPI003AAB6622
MEIVAEFVPNLHAFHYPNVDSDELESVLDGWNDPMFLFDFFSNNKPDLKGKYTVEEATEQTRNDVNLTFLVGSYPNISPL